MGLRAGATLGGPLHAGLVLPTLASGHGITLRDGWYSQRQPTWAYALDVGQATIRPFSVQVDRPFDANTLEVHIWFGRDDPWPFMWGPLHHGAVLGGDTVTVEDLRLSVLDAWEAA